MEGSVDYQEGLNKRDPSQPSMILVLWIWKRSFSFQLFDLDVDNSYTRGGPRQIRTLPVRAFDGAFLTCLSPRAT